MSGSFVVVAILSNLADISQDRPTRYQHQYNQPDPRGYHATDASASHFYSGELLWLHAGQAGIQMAGELWNMFSEDHDINGPNQDASPAAYYMLKGGLAMPRNLLVDTDPLSIAETVQKKQNRCLFSRRHFLPGTESTGGLYPRGVFSQVSPRAVEKSRLLLEEADNPKGFVFIYGSGGGSGSGISSYISRTFTNSLPKMAQVHLVVAPNPGVTVQPSSPLEPYNVALLLHDLKETDSCVVMVDNDALYNVGKQKVKFSKPSYDWANRLFSHGIATMSAGWRFPSNPSVRFDDLPTNMVPFRSAKFSVMSFAPMFPVEARDHEILSTGDLTRELLETRSYMIRCNPRFAAFSSSLFFRGSAVSSIEVAQTLTQQIDRKGVNFVKWMKPSFKIGITPRVPPNINGVRVGKCACQVTNTTAIYPTFEQIQYSFGSMFRRRAFVHWYEREGYNPEFFFEAWDTLCDVIETYGEGLDQKPLQLHQ